MILFNKFYKFLSSLKFQKDIVQLTIIEYNQIFMGFLVNLYAINCKYVMR